MKNSEKNKYKYDNIPIAPSLVKGEYKEVVDLYMRLVNYTKFTTDNQNLQNIIKVRELSDIEDIFLETREYDKDKLKFVLDLKKCFVKELLAPSLIKDFIAAAKKDASNFEYKTWAQLVDYCSNYSGTILRFLLALYDESPSTYMPAASLGVAFQMLINIKNLRENASLLKRVYLPKDMLEKYGIKIRDLYQPKSSKEVKKLINELLKEIKKLIKDARILPAIIKNQMLRMQFCMILSSTNILYGKISKTDVLKKKVTLTKFDLFDSYLTGIVEGIFTSYKSVSTKGLKR